MVIGGFFWVFMVGLRMDLLGLVCGVLFFVLWFRFGLRGLCFMRWYDFFRGV